MWGAIVAAAVAFLKWILGKASAPPAAPLEERLGQSEVKEAEEVETAEVEAKVAEAEVEAPVNVTSMVDRLKKGDF